MATPNLYLPIKKASLCHWYECYKQQDLHKIQKLYYSTTPVRGIYAVTTDRRHYLVAIRPVNGKKDTENIFEAARNSYDDANFRCQAAKVNQTTTHSLSNMFSSTAATLIGNDDNENRNNSGYSFTHLEHIKILEQAKLTYSKNDILHGTGGIAPHQKSPFQNHPATKHNNRISPLLNFLGYQGKSKLQGVDINGFKKLRQPLQIQFCSITQRLMLSSEIKTRTETVLVCKDSSCMRRRHEGCEKEVWREMFVLDDGYSWVQVEKFGKGKRNILYRVDDETQSMRRQSTEEMKVSMWYLEREKGRFLEYDERAEYMSLVRYIQKVKVDEEREVKKGHAYIRKIEKESAERLVEERLEKEWAERVQVANNNCTVGLVKTRKVEVRQARIGASEVGEIVEME
jgi:hypothetical protein